MDMDTDSLFGDHTRVRSFSDSEDDYADDPDPEARRPEQEQAPDGQEAGTNEGEAKKVEPAKVKRVIKNPQPKLDPQRLAGPRGMFHVQKVFKDVKWKGKGHEKEDLSLLLKHLEHWAHRLYPKLPFQDTLEAIEKLGMKKNVQVHMKRIRLDMVDENGKTPEDEDDVLREPEPEEEAPQGDIFDELIGQNFSSVPPAATQMFPTPIASPPDTAPKPRPTPLTEEQKERLERNKRLAEEKRKSRFLQQMEKKQAEANEAISKEDKTEGTEESEKENMESRNDSSYLESTNLPLKESKKSLDESKPRESDNIEVDETESDNQKGVISSNINSSNTPENSCKISTNESLHLESTNVSYKEKEISSEVSKTRESDNMEVDEIESDKQKDASSTIASSNTNIDRTENCSTINNITVDSDKNKGQREGSEDISENMEEKTSDELSQKNLTASDSKPIEGMCTEEEMLAMIDSDL